MSRDTDITFDVKDIIQIPGPPGPAGEDGKDGVTFTPAVSQEGVISWTNDGELPNPQSVNIKGPAGADGAAGSPGAPGSDGFSPVVTVTQITGGHQVAITDSQGTDTFDVLDGQDGAAGSPGAPGSDGVSPSVSVTQITGGHQVAITDAQGTNTFDVLDGTDGSPGSPGAAGERGGRYLRVTTAPSSWGGSNPSTSYRQTLSQIKTQSGISEVLVGDIVFYDTYYYEVGRVDTTYAYLKSRQDMKGPQGPTGPQGPPGSGGGLVLNVTAASEVSTDFQSATVTGYTDIADIADGAIARYDDGSGTYRYLYLDQFQSWGKGGVTNYNIVFRNWMWSLGTGWRYIILTYNNNDGWIIGVTSP